MAEDFSSTRRRSSACLVSLRAARAFSSSERACPRSLEFDDREHVALRDPAAEFDFQLEDAAGHRRQHLHGAGRIGFHHGRQGQAALNILFEDRRNLEHGAQRRALRHREPRTLNIKKSSILMDAKFPEPAATRSSGIRPDRGRKRPPRPRAIRASTRGRAGGPLGAGCRRHLNCVSCRVTPFIRIAARGGRFRPAVARVWGAIEGVARRRGKCRGR